jgi:hypothetical protein
MIFLWKRQTHLHKYTDTLHLLFLSSFKNLLLLLLVYYMVQFKWAAHGNQLHKHKDLLWLLKEQKNKFNPEKC